MSHRHFAHSLCPYHWVRVQVWWVCFLSIRRCWKLRGLVNSLLISHDDKLKHAFALTIEIGNREWDSLYLAGRSTIYLSLPTPDHLNWMVGADLANWLSHCLIRLNQFWSLYLRSVEEFGPRFEWAVGLTRGDLKEMVWHTYIGNPGTIWNWNQDKTIVYTHIPTYKHTQSL